MSEPWECSAWNDTEATLKQLENDSSETARLRRINIWNAQADFLYGLSDVLKQEGRHEDADQTHSRANERWGMVVAAVSTQ